MILHYIIHYYGVSYYDILYYTMCYIVLLNNYLLPSPPTRRSSGSKLLPLYYTYNTTSCLFRITQWTIKTIMIITITIIMLMIIIIQNPAQELWIILLHYIISYYDLLCYTILYCIILFELFVTPPPRAGAPHLNYCYYITHITNMIQLCFLSELHNKSKWSY